MAQHYRVGRLSQEIQREVNDILTKRVRDPRVQGVTITGVEVTGDLQHATIYYSTLSNLASDADSAYPSGFTFGYSPVNGNRALAGNAGFQIPFFN